MASCSNENLYNDNRWCGQPFKNGQFSFAPHTDWTGYDVTSAGWGAISSLTACVEFTHSKGYWFFTFDDLYNNCYVKAPKRKDGYTGSLYAVDNWWDTPWVLQGYDFPGSFDPWEGGFEAGNVWTCRWYCNYWHAECMAFNYEPDTKRCYLKTPNRKFDCFLSALNSTQEAYGFKLVPCHNL
ncbi:hypothetical protein BDR26DRAFT_922986 [Obelidium mucronatum]|nr:hypothetical protein BDR26DRAFT_922986 [Obelidium mucronatum]